MANSKKGTKQVNPPSPKQVVGSKHGGKAQLVDAIIGLLGDAPDGTRARLMQTSNSKLLSHHHNSERMQQKFGGKDGLVNAIVAVRWPKGAPEGEREKLVALSPWRLMDLHRQAEDLQVKAQKAVAVAAKAKAAKQKRHGRTAAPVKAAPSKKKK